jgi:hypothetical protein
MRRRFPALPQLFRPTSKCASPKDLNLSTASERLPKAAGAEGADWIPPVKRRYRHLPAWLTGSPQFLPDDSADR